MPTTPPPPQRSRSPSIAIEAIALFALSAVGLALLVVQLRGGVDLIGLGIIGGAILALLTAAHLAVRLLGR